MDLDRPLDLAGRLERDAEAAERGRGPLAVVDPLGDRERLGGGGDGLLPAAERGERLGAVPQRVALALGVAQRPRERESLLDVGEPLLRPREEHERVPAGRSRRPDAEQLAGVAEQPGHPLERVRRLADASAEERRHRAPVQDPRGAARVTVRLEQLQRRLRPQLRSLEIAEVQVHDRAHRVRLGPATGILAGGREGQLHQPPRGLVVLRAALEHGEPPQQVGSLRVRRGRREGIAQVALGPIEIARPGQRLGPDREQPGSCPGRRLEPERRVGEAPALLVGEPRERQLGRPGVAFEGPRDVAGRDQVVRDLGRLGALRLERARQGALQAHPTSGLEAGRDHLRDGVVRRDPSLLPEPHEPRPREQVERREDLRRPAVEGRGEGPCRRLPAERRERVEHVQLPAIEPGQPRRRTAPLRRTGGVPSLLRRDRPRRAAPARCVGADQPPVLEEPDGLDGDERGRRGLGGDRGRDPRVAGRPLERVLRQRSELDRSRPARLPEIAEERGRG